MVNNGNDSETWTTESFCKGMMTNLAESMTRKPTDLACSLYPRRTRMWFRQMWNLKFRFVSEAGNELRYSAQDPIWHLSAELAPKRRPPGLGAGALLNEGD
jgi:hypothetical protein